jgi:cephalosporin hydroxylase
MRPVDRVSVDLERGRVILEREGSAEEHPLASAEGFAAVSRAWLRAGWDAKYVYSFTWLGRPVIQLPEDLVRTQELVVRVRPDVILETGIAHGGSLVFYASLCRAMDHGRVIGVDVEIRPHNRTAIEEHFLYDLITLVEGSSTDPEVVEQVRSLVQPGERVLVVLDARHTKDHVKAELDAYAPLVPSGSYIVAADGIMAQLGRAPRTEPDWEWNNPRRAAEEWVRDHPDWVLDDPPFSFNEGMVTERVTYYQGGLLRRLSEQ